MINNKILEELNLLGFGDDINALETYVGAMQDAAADGEPIVTDAMYDQHVRLLRVLRPDSELLIETGKRIQKKKSKTMISF